jgi:hypothetical protein
MRQSATTPASLSSTTATSEGLHPVLRTALANLDVQLEEELARYRRQRAGGSSVARHANRKRTAKQPDLIAIAATDAKVVNFEPTNSESQIDVTNRDAENQEAIAANLALANPSTASNLSSNLDDAADLQQPDAQLDDYLESSEELLRSLAEEEAKVQAERGFMRNLLTPLGVGSMLLLLLSSALFGYLVMNPASLSQIFANRDASTAPDALPQSPQAATLPGGTTPQPNLANREFKDLNLNTLGTLKPNAARASAAVPKSSSKPSSKPATVEGDRPAAATPQPTSDSPTATATTSSSTESSLIPVTPARPAAPESEAPRSAPEPPEPLPAIRNPAPPVVAAPVPAPVSTSRSEELPYKVVTPYTGDAALEEAKRTAPDAFVRNDDNGANIQVGAYSSSADADSQVRELRQRGISAEVQKR